MTSRGSCALLERKSARFSFNSRKRNTRNADFRLMASSTSGTTGQSPRSSVLSDLAHLHLDRYYDRVYIEKTLNFDECLVKEYFPVSVIVPTILRIYQDLLRVKFIEIKDDNKDVWHPGACTLRTEQIFGCLNSCSRSTTVRCMGEGCQR
jgi:hypothetical protein